MKLMLNGKEVSGMGHYVMAGDIKDATAEDSNVLSGKAFYNNNGKREGIMPNRGGMSAELAAGGSVSIPEGYHNGEGVVRAQDLASQTAGTAAAANIEAGYTAWVNGEMVEGTGKMDPYTSVKTLDPGTSYTFTFTPSISEEDSYLRITDKFGLVQIVSIYSILKAGSHSVSAFKTEKAKTAISFHVVNTTKIRMEINTGWKFSDLIATLEEVRMK